MRKLKFKIDSIEQEISVSDEVFSAFMDPIWREKKKEQRRKTFFEQKKLNFVSIESSEIPIVDPDTPEDAYLQKEFRRELMLAMKTLASDEADLIKSIYWGGLSLSDYSKKSGIPYTTLVYRHKAILRKLRLALGSTR